MKGAIFKPQREAALQAAAQKKVNSPAVPRLFATRKALHRPEDIFVFKRIDSARLNSRLSP
jgi:hypothetical protein